MAARVDEKSKRERLSPAAREQQIVRAAYDILVTEGYAALSYSRIAKLCDIRLSTVQHRFPDRSVLIAGVTKLLLDELLDRYVASAPATGADPAACVETMVRLLTADTDNIEIATLFFELWAFGQRDPAMAAAIDQLYRQVRAHLCTIITAALPGIKAKEALRRAIMVMAMADGLTVTLGHTASMPEGLDAEDRERLVARLVRLALEG